MCALSISELSTQCECLLSNMLDAVIENVNSIAKAMPIAIISWFIVIVMFFIRHRHICLPYAPHLTALTFTIVALACIRFVYS
ncbi:hypothetical protein BD413DRAFT_496694 [Trametes elegans]|nr:hypothetical protein BD413DRAFT_496694 [Trametes elegans]